jgi:hypothetical protein
MKKLMTMAMLAAVPAVMNAKATTSFEKLIYTDPNIPIEYIIKCIDLVKEAVALPNPKGNPDEYKTKAQALAQYAVKEIDQVPYEKVVEIIRNVIEQNGGTLHEQPHMETIQEKMMLLYTGEPSPHQDINAKYIPDPWTQVASPVQAMLREIKAGL